MRRHLIAMLGIIWAAGAVFFGSRASLAQSTRNLVMDCAFCHSLHGGGGYLLKVSDTETLCLSCHGPGGIATEAAVHTNPGSAYGNYRISCMGCHNSHYSFWNGRDSLDPDPWFQANPTFWLNKKLVGVRLSQAGDVDNVTGQPVPEGLAVYVTPNSGVRQVVFGILPVQLVSRRPLVVRSDWANTSGPYQGACNTCHTQTKHHRNSDSGGDHTHNVDRACADCHLHTKGWIK